MSLSNIFIPNSNTLYAYNFIGNFTTASGGTFNASGANIIFHTLSQDNGLTAINSSGNYFSSGSIFVSGSINASGGITSDADITAAGNLHVYNDIYGGGQLITANAISAPPATGNPFTANQIITGNVNFTGASASVNSLPSAADLVTSLSGNIFVNSQFDCIFTNAASAGSNVLKIINSSDGSCQMLGTNQIVLNPHDSVYCKFNLTNISAGTEAASVFVDNGKALLPLSIETDGKVNTTPNTFDIVNGSIYLNINNADVLAVTFPNATDIIAYLGSGNVYSESSFETDIYCNLKNASGGTYGVTLILGSNCNYFTGALDNQIGFTETAVDPTKTVIFHVNFKYVVTDPVAPLFTVYPSFAGVGATVFIGP